MALDLSNASRAVQIWAIADFEYIRGFSNLIDASVRIESGSNLDCSQFSSILYGDIFCNAANSSYMVTKHGNDSITYHPGYTFNSNLKSSPKPSPTITKVWIGLIVSLPTSLILLFSFLLYMDHRRSKKWAASNQHPEIPELPLGGHNEKAELETNEMPGELSVATEIPDIQHSPISPSAHIIDVREVDIQLFRGAEMASGQQGEVHEVVEVVGESEVVGNTSEPRQDVRLQVLTERLEKVRNEKEILSKLQELEEMENVLKKEIMEEQRKVMRRGAGDS